MDFASRSSLVILASIWLILGKAKRESASALNSTNKPVPMTAKIARRVRVFSASGSRRPGSELEVDECIGFTRGVRHHQDCHDRARKDRHRNLLFFKDIL